MKNFTPISVLLSLAILMYCTKLKNPILGILELTNNPREFTWSIDTLAHPDNWQSSLLSLWASSARNVYVAGIANTSHGILWHFNGKEWSDIKISGSQGGPIIGPISFSGIFGFSQDDVWIVGSRYRYNPNPPPNVLSSSLVVHYDGIEWKEIPTPSGHSLTTVWGPSPDNIWIAGVNGTLFHYDGISVEKDTIPLYIPRDASPFYNVMSIAGNEYEAYMLLADWNSRPNRYFFLEHIEDEWVIQDSMFFYNSDDLWMSPSGRLYAVGSSVYCREDGVWNTLLEGFDTLYSNGIHGTNDNNIFVVGRSNTGSYPGAVYHFNGTDWFSYQDLEIPEYIYSGVCTVGNEVFITGKAGSQSVVLHGK